MSNPDQQLSMQVKGLNGTVGLDGKIVTITRSGFVARATIGKGDKRIPVGQITAVQFKPADFFGNGYIAFTLGGGNEQHARFGRQSFDAAKDENAVIFMKNRQADFEGLRDAIEAAMTGVPAAAGAAQPDAVDQLGRLAELRDTGVLSAEEFAAAKARILGGL